jgi:hypothetical protein
MGPRQLSPETFSSSCPEEAFLSFSLISTAGQFGPAIFADYGPA